MQTEVSGVDHALASHQDGALDHMIHFPHVPWPVMLKQKLPGAGIKPAEGFAIPGAMLLQKMLRQQRNVLAPLPQRRHMNFDGVQPKKQILAESSSRHFSA